MEVKMNSHCVQLNHQLTRERGCVGDFSLGLRIDPLINNREMRLECEFEAATHNVDNSNKKGDLT